jgi:alkaline phosphatase D
MRAYFEYTPLDDALFPRLHRAFRFGRLATLFAIDERQYRDGPVCPSGPLKSQCDASRDASRTMLGAQQKSWLLGGLEGSGTTWNVLLSQVLMMPQILVDRPEGLERGVQEDLLPQHPLHDGADAAAKRKRARGDLHLTLDSFDGYPAERAELADALAARGRGNTLVWTGDIHNCYAGHLRTDANSVGSPEGFRAAFEMSTGSVSSIGAGDVFRFGAARLIEGHVKRANRHMSFLDLRHHMYVRVTIGREWARHETVCVDTTLRRRYRTFVGAALLVERGSLEVSREA